MNLQDVARAIDKGAAKAREKELEWLETEEKFRELSEERQVKCLYLVIFGYGNGTTIDELITKSAEVEFFPGATIEEIAQVFIEEGVFGDIDEKLWGYLDFGAIATDLEIDGYDETALGVFKIN